MKISWGTGIIMAFVAFIGFIMYFVIIASTDERAEHDLVTDQYYEQELGFQDEITARQKVVLLKEKVTVTSSPEGLWLQFPDSRDGDAVNGSVRLYRPSNKKLDFELPIALDKGRMLVPSRQLPEGRWNLSIRWEIQGTAYRQDENITYLKSN